MEVLDAKVISGCIIFILTFLCGWGPFLLLRRFTGMGSRHRNRAASRINSTQAFACGIFIGTCLLHLLPEATEGIQESLASDLPLSEMLVAFGFLLLLVTENFILARHDRSSSSSSSAVERERSVIVTPPESCVNDNSYAHERRSLTDGQGNPRANYGSMNDALDSQVRQKGSASPREGEQYSSSQASNSQHPCSFHNVTLTEDAKHPAELLWTERRGHKPKSDEAKHDSSKGKAKSDDTEKKEGEHKTAVLKSFVLLFALSLHTVFDGLVVGLQSKHSEVWTLLAAVGLHKVLISVSIALSLLESHYHHPTASLLYLFLFSLVAPAGLAVGVILTEPDFDTHAQTLTSGILQSVATGTFMYVTFVESLKGRFEGRDRLLNVLLVVIGFGLVCGLRVVLPG